MLDRRPGGARRPARPRARAAGRPAARHAASGSPRRCGPGCCTRAAATTVAAELHVHAQTVRYRMGQLRELYGDRLDDPAAVLELVVALSAPTADGS